MTQGYNDAVEALRWLIQDLIQEKYQFVNALLGDGQGNVNVPGRDNYVYVRFERASSRVSQVFNRTVTAGDNTPIVIGYLPWQPDLQQVLDVNWQTYLQSDVWNDSFGSGQAHGASHEWSDSSVGVDTFNVHTRQIYPLRLEALSTSTSGSFSVRVQPYGLSLAGAYRNWPGGPNLDLSGLVPATGSQRYALVYWNPFGGEGVYGRLGAVTGSLSPYDGVTLPERPSEPSGTISSGYVLLYGGQAGIYEANLEDGREFLQPYSGLAGTGSSGGGGGDLYWQPEGGTGPDIYYASGSVGIGIASPSSALHVSGRAMQTGAADITGYLHANAGNLASTTDVNPGLLVYGPTTGGSSDYYGLDLGYNNSRFRLRLFSGGDIALGTATGVDMDVQSDFSELMTLRGDTGRVGIGTANPDGFLTIQSTTIPQLRLRHGASDYRADLSVRSSGATLDAYNDAGAAYLPFNYNALTHTLSISGTEAMVIDAATSITMFARSASNPGIRFTRGTNIVYLQVGVDNTDSAVDFRIARFLTGTSNIGQFSVYANASVFKGQVYVDAVWGHLRLRETDQFNKEWVLQVDGQQFRLTESGVAHWMAIDNGTGYIGIGNQLGPANQLHVGPGTDPVMYRADNGYPGILINNNGYSNLTLRNSTHDVEAAFLLTNASAIIGTTSNHTLVIRTNNTTRIQVNTSGNVAIYEALSVGSSLTVSSTATLNGNATVGGTLGVTGAATFSSTTSTSGWVTNDGQTSNGTIYAQSHLRVQGDLRVRRSSTDYTGHIFVPFTTPINVWSGTSFSTVSSSTFLSNVSMGIPNEAVAVLVRLAVRDTVSTADSYFGFGPTSTYWYVALARAQVVNVYAENTVVVPTNGSGDVYYRAKAASGSSLQVVFQVWGYFI